MSVESVVVESPSVNSLHEGTVDDGREKPSSNIQNGQCYTTFTSSVNTTNDAYVDTGPTTPLLSDHHTDNSEDDDGADASEELSSDSATDSLIKRADGTAVDEETSLRIAFQVFFPYLVAGFGMVGAGAVLEIVKVKFMSFLVYNAYSVLIFA